MTLLIILFVISIIIFLANILFIFLFPKFDDSSSNADLLNISIVIAFKNESNNLEKLFSSLSTLNFATDKYEVILVDDGSSDNSYQKASELSKDKNNYQIIKAEKKKYPGKKGALEFAISKARYPYILITDADCMPEKNWLLTYSQKFRREFDLLFGLSPFIQTKNIINKISCFENMRSSVLTFVLAKLGLPYSAAARNLGFKKSSFEKIGGFVNTIETQSGDDDLLIRESVKNKLKIGVVNSKNSSVFTNSKETLREYLNQKARHTKTSHHYLPIHKMILGLWHSANILLLFSILLLPVNILFLLPILIKLISDFIAAKVTQNKFHYSFSNQEIFVYQVFYEVFLVINFLSSLRKNIIWKN